MRHQSPQCFTTEPPPLTTATEIEFILRSKIKDTNFHQWEQTEFLLTSSILNNSNSDYLIQARIFAKYMWNLFYHKIHSQFSS